MLITSVLPDMPLLYCPDVNIMEKLGKYFCRLNFPRSPEVEGRSVFLHDVDV